MAAPATVGVFHLRGHWLTIAGPDLPPSHRGSPAHGVLATIVIPGVGDADDDLVIGRADGSVRLPQQDRGFIPPRAATGATC